MKLLTRSLTQEYLRGVFLGIIIFTTILFLQKTFTIVELVLLQGLGLSATAWLVILFLPPVLLFTLPMSVLLASLLLFGRMSADGELTAWRAGGISVRQLLIPLVWTTALIVLLAFVNNAVLSPYSYRAIEAIARRGEVIDPFESLSPNTLTRIEKFLVSVGGIDPQTRRLSKIYLNSVAGENEYQTVVAESGSWARMEEADGWIITLRNGSLLTHSSRHPDRFRTTVFTTYTVPVERPTAMGRETRPKALSLTSLIEAVRDSAGDSAPALDYALELQRRFAIPCSALLFLFVGAALGMTNERSGKNAGFGYSLLIFLIYYLLLIGGEALAYSRALNTPLVIWIPNTALLGAGVYLLRRPSRQ